MQPSPCRQCARSGTSQPWAATQPPEVRRVEWSEKYSPRLCAGAALLAGWDSWCASRTQQLLARPSPLRAAVAGQVPTLLSSSDTFFVRNHRMAWVRRGRGRWSSPPPCRGWRNLSLPQVAQSPIQGGLFKVRTLNTSNDGSSTALLGNLSQCLTPLITKKSLPLVPLSVLQPFLSCR